jgi:hypothetical protein
MRTAYIVANFARPGDILLTVGTKWPIQSNWTTWVIRAFTWSWYSHASIMMTRLGRLETNGPGLTSQLTVGRTLRDSNGHLLIDTGARKAVLLRPTLQAISSTGCASQFDFSLKVMKGLFAYLGREYAEPIDLRHAAKFPFGHFLGAIAHLPLCQNEEYSGFLGRWFCSSLVAQVYSDAGMTLDPKGCQRISPGDLRRSKKLRPVEEAIVSLSSEKMNKECKALLEEFSIYGALRSDKLKEVFESSIKQAGSLGLELAAKDLEAELDRRLKKPSDEIRTLLRCERALRRSRLL